MLLFEKSTDNDTRVCPLPLSKNILIHNDKTHFCLTNYDTLPSSILSHSLSRPRLRKSFYSSHFYGNRINVKIISIDILSAYSNVEINCL